MNKQPQLPTIEKKKTLDTKKLEILAKKVKKYFEEENKYLKEQNEKYGLSKTI